MSDRRAALVAELGALEDAAFAVRRELAALGGRRAPGEVFGFCQARIGPGVRGGWWRRGTRCERTAYAVVGGVRLCRRCAAERAAAGEGRA